MSDPKKVTKSATEATKGTIAKVQNSATDTASAVQQAASAYVAGVGELTRTAFGIGQEVVKETVEHGRASVKANCLGDLASMQAGYVQHRIGASTVHVKALADVASDYVGKVYSPLTGLLNTSSKA